MDAISAQLKALQVVVKDTADEKKVKIAIESFDKQIKAVQSQITSNAGAAESVLRTPNKIREHLVALDGLLEGSDEAPSTAALDQKQLIEPQYESAIQKFNRFLQIDVSAFNQTMSEHKLTGVVAGDILQP
jgi:hypothetical protein